MKSEIMFAGFGGQGILLSAKIMAYAAMAQGLEVAWIPSYGPEMRGGTAYCLVVMSDRPIGSPIVKNPAHLVAMNRPSLEKFAPVVKPGGIVMINRSLIAINSGRDDVIEVPVNVNEVAQAIKSPRSANVVALGAFAAKFDMVDFDTIKECVKKEFAAKKAKLVDINIQALEAGREAALNPAYCPA